MQKVLILTVLAMGLAIAPVSAQQTPSASATLRDAKGNIVGNALFTSTKDGVRIQTKLNDFKSIVSNNQRGEHGIHIHAVGKCTPPSFKSAGSHFNPTSVNHGLLDPDGPHAGDLVNIWIEADGSADYDVTTDLITLDTTKRSVFDKDGSALVIHQTGDDYLTDPAGNSGDRIACGVIVPRRTTQK